jgi:hypothetical protein
LYNYFRKTFLEVECEFPSLLQNADGLINKYRQLHPGKVLSNAFFHQLPDYCRLDFDVSSTWYCCSKSLSIQLYHLVKLVVISLVSFLSINIKLFYTLFKNKRFKYLINVHLFSFIHHNLFLSLFSECHFFVFHVLVLNLRLRKLVGTCVTFKLVILSTFNNFYNVLKLALIQFNAIIHFLQTELHLLVICGLFVFNHGLKLFKLCRKVLLKLHQLNALSVKGFGWWELCKRSSVSKT